MLLVRQIEPSPLEYLEALDAAYLNATAMAAHFPSSSLSNSSLALNEPPVERPVRTSAVRKPSTLSETTTIRSSSSSHAGTTSAPRVVRSISAQDTNAEMDTSAHRHSDEASVDKVSITLEAFELVTEETDDDDDTLPSEHSDQLKPCPPGETPSHPDSSLQLVTDSSSQSATAAQPTEPVTSLTQSTHAPVDDPLAAMLSGSEPIARNRSVTATSALLSSSVSHNGPVESRQRSSSLKSWNVPSNLERHDDYPREHTFKVMRGAIMTQPLLVAYFERTFPIRVGRNSHG
jgi:hypothetical protein